MKNQPTLPEVLDAVATRLFESSGLVQLYVGPMLGGDTTRVNKKLYDLVIKPLDDVYTNLSDLVNAIKTNEQTAPTTD